MVAKQVAVINWLSCHVRTLLARVTELEEQIKQLKPTDAIATAPKTFLSISDLLPLQPAHVSLGCTHLPEQGATSIQFAPERKSTSVPKPQAHQLNADAKDFTPDRSIITGGQPSTTQISSYSTPDDPQQLSSANARAPDGDVQAPKMPSSAYQLFVKRQRPTLTGTIGEIATQLSQQWAFMDTDTQEKFEIEAIQLKLQYDKDMAVYKSSNSYKTQVAKLRDRGIKC